MHIARRAHSRRPRVLPWLSRLLELNPAAAAVPDNRGLIDSMKDWLAKNGDVSKHFENLKRTAEQATEHIIKLIVIFVLQTLVIPLLLLWALYAVVRQVFERPARGGVVHGGAPPSL